MATRTINVSLLMQRPGRSRIEFTPDLTSVDGDVLLKKVYVFTTDAAGDATIALPVKASGTIRYTYKLPTDQARYPSTGEFLLATGSAIDFDELITLDVAETDTVRTYMDAAVATHAAIEADEDTLGHVMVDDETIVADGNGVISAAGNTSSFALEFTAANKSHVNHGNIWLTDTDYGPSFFYDFEIKPTGGQYFFSSGYGGAHMLLIGVSGNSADGYTISGNFYNANTATTTSFSSNEVIRHNEWAYVYLTCDGTWLTLGVNGVQSMVVAHTAVRRVAANTDTVGFVGGSNHQNFTGRIGRVRLMEGAVPFANAYNTGTFRPPVENGVMANVTDSTEANRQFNFVADYRSGLILDISDGLGGKKHHGFLAEDSDAVGSQGYLSDLQLYNRTAANRPQWVVDPFSYPTATAGQQTQIVGTRIYDDFSRADVHYGNSVALSLGSTRIGSAAWQGTTHGILNGNAYGNSSSPTMVYVVDAGNVDATIYWKRPAAYAPTGVGANYKLIFRRVAADSYYSLDVDAAGTGYIVQYVGGVVTILDSMTFGTSWTEAKVIVTALSVGSYADGVLIKTVAIAENLTGTGKGFCLQHPALRISEFGIT